jgi:hypothetical protein
MQAGMRVAMLLVMQEDMQEDMQVATREDMQVGMP